MPTTRNEENVHVVLERHETQLEFLTKKQDEHSKLITELQENDKRILETLAVTAKKSDVDDLRQHIDSSINGILRDALNSVPFHIANRISLWNIILVAGSLSLAILALILKVHG